MEFGEGSEMKKVMSWVESCLEKNCESERNEVRKSAVEMSKAAIKTLIKEKKIKDISEIKNNPDLVLKTFDKLPKKMKKDLAENKKKLAECGKENKCFEISKKDYERLLSEMEAYKEKVQKVVNQSNDPFLKKTMEMSFKKFDELVEKFRKSMKESSKDKTKNQKKKRSGNKK